MDNLSPFSIFSRFKFPMAIRPKFLIIAIVAIIAVAAGGFWYWSKSRHVQTEAPTLGSKIFEKTRNPLAGQVPNANPFKDQKNPLDAIYQNPFE